MTICLTNRRESISAPKTEAARLPQGGPLRTPAPLKAPGGESLAQPQNGRGEADRRHHIEAHPRRKVEMRRSAADSRADSAKFRSIGGREYFRRRRDFRNAAHGAAPGIERISRPGVCANHPDKIPSNRTKDECACTHACRVPDVAKLMLHHNDVCGALRNAPDSAAGRDEKRWSIVMKKLLALAAVAVFPLRLLPH